ncbi:sugar ABC transporter substrate-binding protein [Luteipulveratus sp. YIM 133132]|uniref:Sugar ABC transporter substrate-binding protein n=1 Tax=Luteipulveratus flavus TaxID=3031728 RepID=A0ABT6C7V8_9MICO|nr:MULTISPECIES: sugar ABC transporter substrate-binding protein [unclassified Luteipulveratus]MDE9364192.1 sugar ABC transporter substrate-binding protein [Luteipulveratus sp. YIM 133132]MDF8264953.1 sugar ABC transporter substrate-binding protein [Luteipulveratus sp. YIM 133296]
MKIRLWCASFAITAVAATAACGNGDSGSSESGGGGGGGDAKTLTYWASNQGATLDVDKQVLGKELAKFTQQTGVKVKLEVIGWPDLQNRILAATSSGQGPDVLNIGNTWAASLQSTGAFMPFDKAALDAIGGQSKFVDASFKTSGMEGKDPTSVPLYGLVYGLYYNKKMFADAGLQPPTTWEELQAAAKKLTDAGKGTYGMAMEGGSYTESIHFAFIFGQQHGADPFTKDGKPQFTTPGMVAGVKQYVDLMSDGVVNKSSVQYKNGPEAPGDFAKGKAAMLMSQNNADNTLQADGMKSSDYGVVAIPTKSGNKDTASFVAGINMSVFKDTKNKDGALKLVKFMTSPEEQAILDKPFTALPVVKGGTVNFTDNPAEAKTFADILATKSVPLPLVPAEAAYETNVGNAVNGLLAKAATGQKPSEADIKSALQEAQDKMASAG